MRKVGSGGVAVFVDESAEAVAPIDLGLEATQRDRLDGEKVDRQHALGLLAQERLPQEAGTRVGGTEPGLAGDLADCGR